MGLLASCAKEMQEPVENPADANQVKTVLTVGIEQTKTTMGASESGNRKVYWSNGDKIAVNGTASDALAGIGDAVQTTKFTFTGSLSTPYNVLYPSSIYFDPSTVTLPAVQTYKADGFADGMFPMAGYSADGSSISMSHLCAIVKVSVKRAASSADEDNLVSVRFKGKNNEQVSGDFTIDYQNATLTGTSTADADKVVKVVKSQETSTSTAAVYYVVVPARTYSSGFDIIVQDKNGHIMTKSKASSWTAEAGKQYNMPEFDFVPTGTELGIEISSANELVAFAQRYNSGESDLCAKLVNDITFDATSSAAFNATGGIGVKEGVNGDARNYFCGTFNGNNCTIKSLTATVPLFCATDDGSKIYNLTVDNTCSFTFTHSNTIEGMFGSIVGYHRGELDNVNSAANVTLADKADVTYLTSLGGLVGRAVTGTVKNSEYSGLISTPAGFTSTEKLCIGGLVGRFSNAGSVTGSYFKGAISNAAQISSSDKSNPYTIIGGVVGQLSGGASVTSCTTTSDHATVAGIYSGSEGIIVHKSDVAYYSAVGGIIGEIDNGTVSSCTNGSSIMNTVVRQADDDNTKARYMKTGGIVGKNNASGTVTGCTNNATVYHRSNTRLQSIGGIVGLNVSGGTISSCTNNGDVAQMTTGVDGGDKLYAARCPNVGGVIGENASTNVSDLKNTATLTVSRVESKAANAVDVRLGGVIGSNTAAIDGGSTKNITNTGKVYFNTNFNGTPIKYCIGGIAGYSSASVQNAVNSGYVHFNWTSNPATKVYIGGIIGIMDGNGTISGCDNKKTEVANSGEVNLGATVAAAHKDCCAGGILGYTVKNVTISNCTNNGYVHAAPTNVTITDSNLYVGGISGYMEGTSSISNCSNTGYTNINAGNNTDNDVTKIFADGGIVGVAKGTDASHITISDCTWEYSTANVGSRRGTCGGVAAYAEYTDVENCDVTVNYNMYNHVTGGICGWAVNSSFKNCKFHGTKITASQGFVSGGIVGTLDTGSVVDGCYNYCTDITAPKATTVRGEIAAKSVTGTTIKNCHHTGTISICGDTNFTDGGNNVADL